MSSGHKVLRGTMDAEIRLSGPIPHAYLPREGPEANYISMPAALDRLENSLSSQIREMKGELRSDIGSVKNELREDIRALGTRIAGVETMLADPNTGLGAVNTRVDHKPSKGFIVTVSLLLFSVIAAATAFQGQIQSYLGLASTLSQ